MHLGLYDTLVLLLDFNSLYPSIIQQFNICFTTIRYDKNSDCIAETPQGAVCRGILPTEIEHLVTQRQRKKRLLAKENDPEKKKQLDIEQKALKLTANSMFGCLGFVQSRFYAKPIAALVTAKGREVSGSPNRFNNLSKFKVIYGDTDSIMVSTGDRDMNRAARIAKEITELVNDKKSKIELKHEATFRRMLLLNKKKYAALAIQENGETKKELKGLDIVRRDWSMIAKTVGSDVVDAILNPDLSREDIVVEVSKLLSSVTNDIETTDLGKFVISKSLTRDPSQYGNEQQQSHVAVARRMNESGKQSYKKGDIVEYVICEVWTTFAVCRTIIQQKRR
ncbi:hypothetical protein PMAYCL1PPCAC_19511 [Pristionchus mayeri]|uniref:DNA-directed DNA polymerase n=1 Tax=Pristionchus mayeri TaxID=1317129 RepID=A0AAN5CRI7_9BILA|nr:hypothetical protein PMAYCL1PPCAC_19511 [Pristionchus mayeri]